MQKGVRYNEGHALYLSVVARKEGSRRGFLSKKTTENSRWTEKYFALYQNVLFYFENDQSTRPSGIYLLEGCTCERAPAPKVSAISKEPMEKQQVGPTQLDWERHTHPSHTSNKLTHSLEAAGEGSVSSELQFGSFLQT